ncbi:amidohydrolase family protein [Methanobrevibacter thaueri]|uniref:5-methylthioadenosine/S-adenosylhomocysteine deaminase n=1 Tax=Methanobrevibacter thaueri TaxID=190975 RepID=A0A315XMA6_9EURY|nr:amidohydrolase family protein [Methanobrevibacter thaueri]PWB87466.1 5-methylthioadenosine/S-adenosylhomocysteine deaminase [Methanobrevibacter thaueri]
MFTIANGIILKGQDLLPVRENVVVDDGKIIEISKEAKEGKIIDVDGAVVCPSFINGHIHIGDSIIKDEGYGLSLSEMVRPPDGVKHVALSNAEDDELIEAMRQSMIDMINSGTTHFIDYREGGIEGVKLLRKASADLPIKPIILGRDDSFYGDDPDLSKVKVAIRKLLKIADGIAPSGFGEITSEVADLIVEECNRQGKISSIHVAESESNQIDSLNDFGVSEIAKGVESDFSQLVHLTNPKGDDLESVASSNQNVVVCPRANATLNVGVTPVGRMLDLGIRPLLGTDNVMLNSPNMLRELEFSLKIMSVYYKSYINPQELLKMATTNVCGFKINDVVQKSLISEGDFAQFIIFKSFSKNPYLNICNRQETKTILYTINKKFSI